MVRTGHASEEVERWEHRLAGQTPTKCALPPWTRSSSMPWTVGTDQSKQKPGFCVESRITTGRCLRLGPLRSLREHRHVELKKLRGRKGPS